MSEKESPQKVIEAHRKRNQMRQGTPIAVMIGAGILLVAGAAALIFWLLGDNSPFKGATPTSTLTLTPSLRHRRRQKLRLQRSPQPHPVHLNTPSSREIT
jgi:hypothetical protein